MTVPSWDLLPFQCSQAFKTQGMSWRDCGTIESWEGLISQGAAETGTSAWAGTECADRVLAVTGRPKPVLLSRRVRVGDCVAIFGASNPCLPVQMASQDTAIDPKAATEDLDRERQELRYSLAEKRSRPAGGWGRITALISSRARSASNHAVHYPCL